MNLKLMKQICRTTQRQLWDIMRKFLISKYGKEKVIVSKDFIIVQGSIPIGLVAHLDTVGTFPPTDIFYDSKKQVMWSPQLLGADDRAGVYAIINIIEKGYRPYIILTTDEEEGCIGARKIISQIPRCPFKELKALIQLDRCGKKDSVYYHCGNKDFEKYINNFGFKTAMGTFSDISVIAPEWEIAAVNLSVGYYQEHSVGEYLRCKELEYTIQKVCLILDKGAEMPFFEYIEKPMKPVKNILFDKEECCICGKHLDLEDSILTPDYNIVCKDCYTMCYNMGTNLNAI